MPKIISAIKSKTKPEFLFAPKVTSSIRTKSKDDNTARTPFDIEDFSIEGAGLQSTPKVPSKISFRSKNDKTAPDPCDIDIFNIDGIETLVVTDFYNSSVKSCYTKGGKFQCMSLKLAESPFTLAKIGKDRAAIAVWSNNIIIIQLTPAPVLVSSIKTEKKYRCLTAPSDKTLAAGCDIHPSIDVLDLSGRVLRSVATPIINQRLIQKPLNMCTTLQGHILVVDAVSGSVYYVTQKGKVPYRHMLTGGFMACRGVTTTDTDYRDDKIIELTETGDYVRDVLTERDRIVKPQEIRVYRDKPIVTELGMEHVKIFQV